MHNVKLRAFFVLNGLKSVHNYFPDEIKPYLTPYEKDKIVFGYEKAHEKKILLCF